MSLDTKQRSYKVVVLFNIRFFFDSADGDIQRLLSPSFIAIGVRQDRQAYPMYIYLSLEKDLFDTMERHKPPSQTGEEAWAGLP